MKNKSKPRIETAKAIHKTQWIDLTAIVDPEKTAEANRKDDKRREDSEARIAKLSKLILSDPKPDRDNRKAMADALRKLPTKPYRDRFPQLEISAMQYLATAIGNGAFSGPKWLAWRTEIAGRPHIVNAVILLEKSHSAHARHDRKTPFTDFETACAIIADLIDGEAWPTFRKPQPDAPEPKTNGRRTSAEAKAMQALLDNDNLDTPAKIAKETGLNKKQISPRKMPRLYKAMAAIKGPKPPKGYKDGKTGEIEGWHEDRY